MITIQKDHDSSILTFVVDGELEQSDVDQVFNDIQAQAQNGNVRLLGEIKRIAGLDLDGVKGFFSTMRDKLSLIGDIDRYAIVTNLDWMSTIAPVSDVLTPGLPIRVFAEAEKQRAIDWLNESADEVHRASIRPIALPDHPQVLGYAVNGKVTSEDYQIISQQLEQAARPSEKLTIYLELLNLEGGTPAALWEDIKNGLEHGSDIDKVALLGSKDWVENLTKAGDFVTPGIDMEFFELGRKQEALDWLTA